MIGILEFAFLGVCLGTMDQYVLTNAVFSARMKFVLGVLVNVIVVWMGTIVNTAIVSVRLTARIADVIWMVENVVLGV